jgi:hypothetical protein
MKNITVGKSRAGNVISIPAHYANRHGLITGATGTGKTVTLQALAEGFSKIGTPVLIIDIKSDVSGLAISDKGAAAPVRFVDVFGEAGATIKLTIARLGPELFGRLLGLSDVQAATLDIAFAVAAARRGRLDTIDELRDVLGFMLGNREAICENFGQVSRASIGVIQRALLRLEREGGRDLFRAPCFDAASLLASAPDGRGVIHILAAERLSKSPLLYSALMLWLLCELHDRAPEVGDLDRPRLVLMIDEAHMLFRGLAPGVLSRIEQVVRLIRSKGFGLYFCTQYPADLPAPILGQLGNRIQHALLAVTPHDVRAVKAAAETLPANPKLDAAALISALPVGCALVSAVGPDGTPQPVELVQIVPPECRLGAMPETGRAAIVGSAGASPAAQSTGTQAGRRALMMLGIITIGIGGYGIYWFLTSGYVGSTVAVLVGTFLALKSRLV